MEIIVTNTQPMHLVDGLDQSREHAAFQTVCETVIGHDDFQCAAQTLFGHDHGVRHFPDGLGGVVSWCESRVFLMERRALARFVALHMDQIAQQRLVCDTQCPPRATEYEGRQSLVGETAEHAV